MTEVKARPQPDKLKTWAEQREAMAKRKADEASTQKAKLKRI